MCELGIEWKQWGKNAEGVKKNRILLMGED